jgi:hypothetical protein
MAKYWNKKFRAVGKKIFGDSSLLIPTGGISNWRGLQDKVAMLFREMGYEVTTPFTVDLSGRGRKEVDVYIRDPRASVNQVILVECKHWESRVRQDAVHSFYTVMHGAGANTGFIISKAGFQSGAKEAAQNTSIHLLSWDELQHKFGRQWFLYRSEITGKVLAELRTIDRIYLEQFTPAPISNWMIFRATGRAEELLEILNDIRVLLMAAIGGPKAYDATGPIEVQVYEGFPGAVKDRRGVDVLPLPDVRSYFAWTENHGSTLLDRFNVLLGQAQHSFDALNDGGDEAFAETLKLVVEEAPIRSFKRELGEETYNRLIEQHLSGGRKPRP